jgi:hypothetical protein
MARRETDREDLLREATALVERAELRPLDMAEPVVVGFRRDGSASFYFGADPVYQFNTSLELRRAFIGGLLYKAERGRLVALRRERRAAAVELVRRELGEDEARKIVGELSARLAEVMRAIETGNFELVGQVPAHTPVLRRIAWWLAAFPSPVAIARSPSVR